MPIQIPGFGEKPEEWIVDRIATHHSKGMGSNFQIVWKAGDRTWATYREVATLKALDRYCKLMGVKNVAILPQNYVNEDSENEENNDIIVRTNACTIKGDDIKARGRMDEESNNSSSSHLTHYTTVLFTMEGFTTEEIQQCSLYELGLRALANGTRHQFRTIKPPRWEEYVDRTYGRDQPQTPIQHTYLMYPYPGYPYPTYQPPPTNVTNMVSMPSEALEAILRAIRRPAEPPRTQLITCVIREPTNYQRGRGFHRGAYRGGYRGRGGRGRGSSIGPNRRGRRSVDVDRRDPTLIVELVNPLTTPINMGPLLAEDLAFLGLAAEEPIKMAREVPIEDITMNGNE